jgi:hypothetical protein
MMRPYTGTVYASRSASHRRWNTVFGVGVVLLIIAVAACGLGVL